MTYGPGSTCKSEANLKPVWSIHWYLVSKNKQANKQKTNQISDSKTVLGLEQAILY